MSYQKALYPTCKQEELATHTKITETHRRLHHPPSPRNPPVFSLIHRTPLSPGQLQPRQSLCRSLLDHSHSPSFHLHPRQIQLGHHSAALHWHLNHHLHSSVLVEAKPELQLQFDEVGGSPRCWLASVHKNPLWRLQQQIQMTWLEVLRE